MSRRDNGPIFDVEVGHLCKVTDIAGDDGKAVKKRNGGDAKVLAADTAVLSLQLPKDNISILIVGQNAPLVEIVNGLNEGSMTLC